MKRLALVYGLVVLASSPSASAQTTITLLDTAGDVGGNPSIVRGADGLGLIAYYDATNKDLKVAHCSNATCTAATITTIDSAGDVGWGSSVAIGTDGLAVISYGDATTPALKVAHCNNTACTSATVTVLAPAPLAGRTAVAIGADGLPLVAYTVGAPQFGARTAHCSVPSCAQATIAAPGSPLAGDVALGITAGRGLIALPVSMPGFAAPPIAIRRCADVACTSFSATAPEAPSDAPTTRAGDDQPLGFGSAYNPAIAVAGDGLPLVGWTSSYSDPLGEVRGMALLHCDDAACTSFPSSGFSIPGGYAPAVAVQPSGLGWVAWTTGQRTHLRTCTNAACTAWTESCTIVNATQVALAPSSDGRPLVAFRGAGGDLGVVHGLDESCSVPIVNVADGIGVEGLDAPFRLTIEPAQAAAVTVQFATANGTATAGDDYVATSGTVTFPAGATSAVIQVPTLTDLVPEPDEAFSLDLSSPSSGVVGVGHSTVTLWDAPSVQVSGCQVQEGDSGTRECVFLISLSHTSRHYPSVSYRSADGTAGLGDYFDVSGSVTFETDVIARAITVQVLGDTTMEPDETFSLNLSNPSISWIADGTGVGTIEDDDEPSLSSLEVAHGSSVVADLAAAPGPTADVDLYRLGEEPYSSWEVVADAVSGDLSLQLERLGGANVTALQTAVPVGTGTAQALRWERRSAAATENGYVRVRSTGCTTACGADDTYRLRVYETTGFIPRYNNVGDQRTVLVLQNPTSQTVHATADFWHGSGFHLHSVEMTLAPKASASLNTATIPVLADRGGSISVTHDAPYGALVGKAVALEPTTGFSFDSPLTYKPR